MSLISPNELADLDGDEVVICDVRFYLDDHDRGRREHRSAHIRGAHFVDLHTDLADTSISGAGRHPLPTTARFGELLGALGVTPDRLVVAYDSAGGAIASRLWWMLGAVGHRHAVVLDGGIDAWAAAGFDVDAEPVPRRGDATPYPVPDTWHGTVGADAVDSGTSLIDARSADRYRGEVEPIDSRAGHVPGAINVFHGDTVGADGRHRSPDELRALFADVGDEPVVYCGSGVTACHNLLALSVAGIDGGLLFPGSWSQWSSDPTRPIAHA